MTSLSSEFDLLAPDEARLMQGIMSLGAIGLHMWEDLLPDDLRRTARGMADRRLIEVRTAEHNDMDALVLTAEGHALLAGTFWWRAPWFIPDSPGWLTNAWFADQFLGMRVTVMPLGLEHRYPDDIPFTAAALRYRPGSDWPVIRSLVCGTAKSDWPSTMWASAVEHADGLADEYGVEVSFIRLKRPDGRPGWGCRIAKGSRSVTSRGERLTGPFRDEGFQGTVLCHAVWLAVREGILPEGPTG